MKMKSLLLAATVMVCGLFTATAQTNNTSGPVQPNLLGTLGNPTISGGLQELYDAALGSTNEAFTFGGGRATTGNYNLVFVDYLYNFNNNVGLVLGFDDIAHGINFNAQNIMFVKGGLNLQAEIAPLKKWGITSFKVTPFTSLLMSEGNGRVGQIVVAGANFKIPLKASWNIFAGPFWENRSGSGLPTDRSYIAGDIAISHGL